MTDESDGTAGEAYVDRNLCAMSFATACLKLGYTAGVRERNSEWPILTVDIPGEGQVSWHIPKAELIRGFPDYTQPWDGHDVATKRRRIRGWIAQENVDRAKKTGAFPLLSIRIILASWIIGAGIGALLVLTLHLPEVSTIGLASLIAISASGLAAHRRFKFMRPP